MTTGLLTLSSEHLTFLSLWNPCFWLAHRTNHARGAAVWRPRIAVHARAQARESARADCISVVRDGGLDSSPLSTDHMLAMLRALHVLSILLASNPTTTPTRPSRVCVLQLSLPLRSSVIDFTRKIFRLRYGRTTLCA